MEEQFYTTLFHFIIGRAKRSERDTLRSVQSRIADIYIIGERAKRTRHSQVCVQLRIEEIYIIIVRANFVLITRKEG